MRILLLVCVVLMSGCCSSWRAGTPTLWGEKYDPGLEPWVGDGVRARRETRECNYFFYGRMYHTEWVYPGSRSPLEENAPDWKRKMYERGFRGDSIWRAKGRMLLTVYALADGEDRREKRRLDSLYRESHDVRVVAVRPLVIATYPSESPTGWMVKYRSDIGSATEFESREAPTLWTIQDGEYYLEGQSLILSAGEQYRLATEWGVLVFRRDGDWYAVTTEGLE